MKNKNLIKNFAILGVGTIANMIIGFITTPIITRIVAPYEYGQLSIFTMYSNIAVMILCLGLDQALVRYYYEQRDIVYKRGLLFKCIKLPILISLLVCLLFMSAVYFKIINFQFNGFILVLLCVYTFVQIIYRFSLLLVRLEYQSKLYSLLNVFQKLFYIVPVLFFVIIFKTNYLNILVICTVMSSVICLLFSVFFQKKIWNLFLEHSCKVSMKELLSYAFPYIFSLGITTIFQAIDKLFLNYYYDYYEVGIYQSAMSIVHIFAIIQNTFNTLWAPIAIEHYTANNNDKDFFKQCNQIIVVIMFFIGLSLIFFKDVFALLLGSNFKEAVYILPFLIFNPIMYTISETTVLGLIFKKKSKMQVISAAGACIINFIGNYLLVPKLGCLGASISTGISYIVFFSLRTILSNKCYYIDYKLKKFYLLTVITSLYAFYNTFNKFNFISVIGYFSCLMLLFLLYKDSIIYIVNYIRSLLNKKMDRPKNKDLMS